MRAKIELKKCNKIIRDKIKKKLQKLYKTQKKKKESKEGGAN